MAFKIGQTPAVDIERTNIRGVEMVVLREVGDPNQCVMFPMHQLGEIIEVCMREYTTAYTRDTLKH